MAIFPLLNNNFIYVTINLVVFVDNSNNKLNSFVFRIKIFSFTDFSLVINKYHGTYQIEIIFEFIER